MKPSDLPEEQREKVKKVIKKLCELPIGHGYIREGMCMACVSQCAPGRELLRLLGMQPPKEPPRIADVFEPVHHARGRRENKIFHAANKRRT